MLSLQAQYEEEIRKTHKPAGKLKKRLKRVYIYYWILIVVNAITLQLASAILSFIFLIGIQRAVKFLTRRDYHRVKVNVKQGKLKLLPRDKARSTWAIIHELGEKMNIDLNAVSVWISSQNSYLPSICQYEFPEKEVFDVPNEDGVTGTEYEYDFSDQQNRTYHLILPKNFLALSIKNRGHAKALIAHEFGHILQKDADLWLASYSFSQNFMGLHVLLAILNLAIIMITIILNLDNFIGSGLTFELAEVIGIWIFVLIAFLVGNVPLFMILRIQRKVTSYRKKSERLADYASVIYNSAADLLECFESYFEKKNTSPVHPNVTDRIASVKQAVYSYPQIRKEAVLQQ